MSHLIWSPHALADIQRLYRFLAKKDHTAASRAIKTIRTGVKILSLQAKMGRPVEGLEPEFREWPIEFGASGYVVMYRFDGELITVLAVRHQKEVGYKN